MIMKSIFTWLVMLLVFALGCATINIEYQPKRLNQTEQLQQQTIALYKVDDEGDAMAYCAGVWIDRTHILTAGHCVAAATMGDVPIPRYIPETIRPIGTIVTYAVFDDFKTQPWAQIAAGNTKRAKVIDYDMSIDLALLETTELGSHPRAWVSRDSIHTGDKVSTIGHTSSYAWSYMPGSIGMVRNWTGPLLRKNELLQVTMPIWFGNSGGGIFNDRGELIGIVSFMIPKGPNIGFCIHRDVVLSFLIKNNLAKP